MASKFIRDRELSEVLGIPLPTIRADRFNERRLPFTKLGRSVLYDPAECIEALKAYRVGGQQEQPHPASVNRGVARKGSRHG